MCLFVYFFVYCHGISWNLFGPGTKSFLSLVAFLAQEGGEDHMLDRIFLRINSKPFLSIGLLTMIG